MPRRPPDKNYSAVTDQPLGEDGTPINFLLNGSEALEALMSKKHDRYKFDPITTPMQGPDFTRRPYRDRPQPYKPYTDGRTSAMPMYAVPPPPRRKRVLARAARTLHATGLSPGHCIAAV